jgi:hypothetical protein
VYKLRPGYIRFLRRIGLSLIILAVVILVAETTISFIQWRRGQTSSDFVFFLLYALLVSLSSLFIGWFILRLEVPQAQIEHMIVCEQGLLQVSKSIGKKQVKMMPWQNILAIKKFPGGYSLSHREGEIIAFDIMYQNVEELIALIRQQSGRI